MEPLEQEQNVKTVTALMDANGRHEVSVDLVALLVIMADLDRRNQALEQELRGMRAELNELKARKSPLAKTMESAVTAAQNCVDSVKEQLSAMRQRVVAWAKDTAENVKLHGISALDKAVSALHIKPMMEAAQNTIQGALDSVRAAVDRGEEMGFQLREAGRAFGNAFKAAQGREENLTPAVQEGRFQKAVLAPPRAVKDVLNGMNETALDGVAKLDALEQAGQASRERLAEKREAKKPSIRKELEDKRAEVKALPAPAPDRTRKPQEAAL